MLQQGTLFDNRYELVRPLGHGGFAEVWLSIDNVTGLEEVLKIYAPGSGLDEDGLKLFVKELSIVHNLRHTNLLTSKVVGHYENQPYLLIAYCPNGSLNKRVGKCSEEEAWKIIEQVASGLAYLHKKGIIHQDIKPDNILIDENNDYVITDFGISMKAQSTLRKSMRTKDNIGTMEYMAPERFSDNPSPTKASDIWSLGAMMYELVEGNVPFAKFGGLTQKNGADLPTMHSNVSVKLKQLIISLLDPIAANRPTAEEIVELAKIKRAPERENKETGKQNVADEPKGKKTEFVGGYNTKRVFVEEDINATNEECYCRKCGKKRVIPDAFYCNQCGTKYIQFV